MAGLRIWFQFFGKKPLPPFFESKCPFFIFFFSIGINFKMNFRHSLHGSAWPCSVLLGSAWPCSLLLGSARQCSAVLGSARQYSALLGTARHCSFPLASFLKGTSDIHCMAVLGLAQYCLAVLGLAHYCSAVLSSARQCSAVIGSA